MTIISAESQIIQRASPAILDTSYGSAPEIRDHVIVTLVDDAGETGYGEASPLPHFTGETAASIDLILREEFLPLLIGCEVFDLHAIHAWLDRLPANPSAKAAIDIALYDLQGKLLNLPVVDLLGGPVRERIQITYPIGIKPAHEAAAEAEQAVAGGISTLKMKVGRSPADDVNRVRTVREAVGPAVRIRVDANAGYRPAEIIRLLDRLAGVGLEYVEQPVAAWDLDGMAEVRRASGVPVMADESLHTVRDAIRLIERRAADIFAIKLIKTSGLTQARTICDIAAAYDIDIVVISPYETQIGAAAGLALALSAPTATRAHELRVFEAQPEYATTGIRVEGGWAYPANAPGLGVESIRELE